MTDLIDYIDKLVAHPARWHTQREQVATELGMLVDAHCARQPATVEALTEALRREYPFIKDNVELVKKGEALRQQLIETLSVEAADFSEQKAKTLEIKLALFDRFYDLNALLVAQAGTVAGVVSRKKALKTRGEGPGTAQSILQEKMGGHHAR